VAIATTDLGEVLVDSDGRTLYIFESDNGSESTCYDSCAENWPPLLAQGAPGAGSGVDASLLGTTERTDGTMQATYNDRPLYRYAGDQATGDTNGQGVGDVWFVVGADGQPITTAAGQNASGSSSSGYSGY
jgi:predicted lipoprotein with Yx(FWY)xxD motif